jgi:hypothetical protein
MTRVFLLIALVWILYRVFKRIAIGASQTGQSSQKESTEKVVQCSVCGLHVPESESHVKNNLIYCNNPECDRQE